MNNMETITIYFLLVLLYFVGLFSYKIEKKSTFFGVKLPYGYNKKENLIQLKSEYKKRFSLSYLFFVLIYIILCLKVTEIWSVVLGNLFVFIGFIVVSINCDIMHKKIKLLKVTENWKLEIEKETMDDENNLMGFIYYNKKNPALWIKNGENERLYLNFAKPLAKAIGAVIMIGIILAFARTLTFPQIFLNRTVAVSDNSIIIEGIEGITVDKEEITKIALEKYLPLPLRRINGTAINKMKMGTYKLPKYKKHIFI